MMGASRRMLRLAGVKIRPLTPALSHVLVDFEGVR